jgi:hypothetical protein
MKEDAKSIDTAAAVRVLRILMTSVFDQEPPSVVKEL